MQLCSLFNIILRKKPQDKIMFVYELIQNNFFILQFSFPQQSNAKTCKMHLFSLIPENKKAGALDEEGT